MSIEEASTEKHQAFCILPQAARGFLLLVFSIGIASCGISFTPEPIPDPFPSPGVKLPVSGYELNFEPNLWNDAGTIQTSTNCYAYALDMRTGFQLGHKLQPGELSGDPISSAQDVEASSIIDKVRSDAGFADFVFDDSSATATCPEDTYKVALVVDPGVDYHWYRQNPDGSWSHKPGHAEVTDLDASGSPIYDPSLADRDYGFIDYSVFGGFFCTGGG